MIGKYSLIDDTKRQFLGCFYDDRRFASPELRRREAQTILIPQAKSAGQLSPAYRTNFDDIYPTRKVLAAQWADSPRQLRQTAYPLYDMLSNGMKHPGETVLRVTGVRPEHIVHLHELPPQGVSVEKGIMRSVPGFHYGARYVKSGNPSEPSDQTLEVQIGLPVYDPQRLHFDPNGSVSVDGISRMDLTGHRAVVSLASDPALYRATREVNTAASLAFGNAASVLIMQRLVELTGGESESLFMKEITNGNIGAEQPLPDLSFLAQDPQQTGTTSIDDLIASTRSLFK